MLCVGLDTDFSKMPAHIQKLRGTARSLYEFNKAIVDATAPHCIAYKPNLAFYECYGRDGMQALEKTVDYIRANYPKQFLITDTKRGDLGNKAKKYGKAFLETMDFDAVTR